MGKGEGGALSLFRFHLSPFPQKRLFSLLRLNSGEQINCLPEPKAEANSN